MDFEDCFKTHDSILMEGALGERLKREYHLQFDEQVAMAALVFKPEGISALEKIWKEYMNIAQKYNLPFLAATPTRRANKERVTRSNFDESIIAANVNLLHRIQQESTIEMYVGGLMGCRGDAYTGEKSLSESEARDFHSWQAELFLTAGVDFLYAAIMPNLFEAAGTAQAMAEAGMPYIISFTIQKNGRLIDGTAITDAIQYIDSKTSAKPVCYMTNCVHPTILYEALSQPFNRNEMVKNRFLGIQANTSPLSYTELDQSIELQCSEPEEFAQDMLKLRSIVNLKIFGGCCGTDNTHMEQLAQYL